MNPYFDWDGHIGYKYPEEAYLLSNIEDIVHRVKTGRECPIKTIQMIKEQIIIYQQNKGNKK
jgi:hypothetical protein